MNERKKALTVLFMNTLAFTVCFAVWMMNGVLVTYLVSNGIYDWSPVQIGILMATPVLTGSLFRLPVGVLTDKHGGRIVYFVLMLLSAAGLFYYTVADSFFGFFMASLGFGLSGASFSVGIAYTSVWFSRERQGTALGVFGAGNAGAAVTLLAAPHLIQYLTDGGADPDGWRKLPLIYAAALVVMAIVFWLFTYNKVTTHGAGKTLGERLSPLKNMRVWRFGAYYFLVFGGFVALSQWLVPYYVKFYELSLATAGFYAAIFSLPSGVIRAVGGWMSDHWGARRVMYWVLGTCTVCCLALIFPRMDVMSPGEGVIASADGQVVTIEGDQMVIRSKGTGKEVTYRAALPSDEQEEALMGAGAAARDEFAFLPKRSSWQQWASKVVVEDGKEIRRPYQVGDTVKKKELLAAGRTHIFFQANVYVFTFIVFLIGIAMGIGKAAVYKHIPDYFPEDVGVVGGLVGVIGGLGGFFCPIIFGQLLGTTGLWTTCWMFLFLFSLACLIWMHRVVERMMRKRAPELMTHIESHSPDVTAAGS